MSQARTHVIFTKIRRRRVRLSVPGCQQRVSLSSQPTRSESGSRALGDDLIASIYCVTDRVGVQVEQIDRSSALSAVYCCSVRSACENGDGAKKH